MEVNGVPNKYLKLEVEIPEVQRVPISIRLTMTFSYISFLTFNTYGTIKNISINYMATI